MAEEYPDITDWKNLNKYADLFKTSESGDKGQLLDGDPSYVTNDEALVDEPRTSTSRSSYARQRGGADQGVPARPRRSKKPLLAYFYDPQWLSQPRSSWSRSSCRRTPRAATPTRRRSPATTRRTSSTRSSARSSRPTGGAAYELVKNFNWTNVDQNTVSELIANQGMTPEAAGEKWVTDEPRQVGSLDAVSRRGIVAEPSVEPVTGPPPPALHVRARE